MGWLKDGSLAFFLVVDLLEATIVISINAHSLKFKNGTALCASVCAAA
jgi:hypothetical protein